MDFLAFSQTLFYLTVSLAIIVLGALAAIIAYYSMEIAKHLNKIAGNLDQASDEIKENIKELTDKLSQVPFLSFLIKRENSKKAHSTSSGQEIKKGRK